MKPICTLLAAFTFIMTIAFSAFAADSPPDVMVKSTVDEVMAVIKQNRDKRALHELVEQKVLPHFDFKRMTQLAVGRPWRDASPTQQTALENGFRTLLVNTYTTALTVSATGKEKVEVKPVKVGTDQSEVLVKTTVTDSNSQLVPVDYRLEKEGGGWKVTDVVIENLSLVTNYRGTFASEISRGGIDGLIKALEDKNRAVAKG